MRIFKQKDYLIKFNKIKILKRGTWAHNIDKMTAIIYPLYQQKKFLDILKNSNLLEGDLIRIFMRIMDKLEQLTKALNDEKNLAMVKNCKGLLRSSLEGIHLF